MSDSSIPGRSLGFLEAAAKEARRSGISPSFLDENSALAISPEAGSYIALKGFTGILSDLQKKLSAGGVLEVDGKSLDTQKISGSVGLPIYLQKIEGGKKIISDISERALEAQNTSLTSHRT